MIRNDRELSAAQAQIAGLQRALLQMRGTVSLEEFRLVARSSRPMIERIQREILDYLTKPLPQLTPSSAATAS